MVCPSCYQDYISKCSNSITVNAGLEPETDYAWFITDKFDKTYAGRVTTDGDGLAAIDISELPDGLLTQHSGYFLFEMVNVDTPNDPTILAINSTDYNCIEFKVKDGTEVKTYLGEFAEETASS